MTPISRTKRGNFNTSRTTTSGTTTSGSGYFDYTAERVVCPSSQNKGDKIRGTNFYYTVTKQLPLRGSYSYKNSSYTYRGNGEMHAIAPRRVLDAAAISNCSNVVISNVLEKIRGQIDLSVDAFQLSQTARMIMNPIRGFTEFVKRFRRNTWRRYISQKWKNRPSWSKYFSSKWLEAIYGWYPFVQTAYAVAGQAANISKPGPSLQLFTAASGINDTRTFPDELQNFAGQNHYISVASSDRVKMKAFALLKLSDSAKAKMVSTYTSMNPAAIAWELTPFSFVVDWFYGIGDYLRAVESATIYNAMTDSFWISRTRIVNTTAIGLPWKTSSMRGALVGSGNGQEISFERIRFHTIPLPSRPVTKGVSDLHWTQLTSALALLRQAFR